MELRRRLKGDCRTDIDLTNAPYRRVCTAATAQTASRRTRAPVLVRVGPERTANHARAATVANVRLVARASALTGSPATCAKRTWTSAASAALAATTRPASMESPRTPAHALPAFLAPGAKPTSTSACQGPAYVAIAPLGRTSTAAAVRPAGTASIVTRTLTSVCRHRARTAETASTGPTLSAAFVLKVSAAIAARRRLPNALCRTCAIKTTQPVA